MQQQRAEQQLCTSGRDEAAARPPLTLRPRPTAQRNLNGRSSLQVGVSGPLQLERLASTRRSNMNDCLSLQVASEGRCQRPAYSLECQCFLSQIHAAHANCDAMDTGTQKSLAHLRLALLTVVPRILDVVVQRLVARKDASATRQRGQGRLQHHTGHNTRAVTQKRTTTSTSRSRSPPCASGHAHRRLRLGVQLFWTTSCAGQPTHPAATQAREERWQRHRRIEGGVPGRQGGVEIVDGIENALVAGARDCSEVHRGGMREEGQSLCK